MGNTERRLQVLAKQRQALELRQAGYSYDVIAEMLHYADRSGAHKAVTAGLKAALREPAQQLRTLEEERLDKLQTAVWARALAGDAKMVDRALRILERRAKLLGLDAPRATAWEPSLDDIECELLRLGAELTPKGGSA
jgi:DNA-binding transcriptional MerR regulator